MNLRDMPWRPRSAALIALNGVVGVLVIVVAARGTQTRSMLSTPARPLSVEEISLTRPAVSPGLGAIQDRALLYASRRFYTAPVGPTAPPHPQYRLVGTFIIPQKPAVAFLAGATGGSRKVKPGDTLDGWLVEAVEAHRVTLRYEAETFDINGGGPGKSGLTVQAAPVAHAAATPAATGIHILGSSPSDSMITRAPPGPSAPPLRLTSGTSTPQKPSGQARLYIPPPQR